MEKKSKQESCDDEEERGRDEQEDTGDSDSHAQDASADEEDDGPTPLIKPVERKIGEGRDNLRQREAWFRRRSGTGR
jgi:hypothetical protein